MTLDALLRVVHIVGAAVWIVSGVLDQTVRFARSRLLDPAGERRLPRRPTLLLVFEHAGFVLALLAGFLLVYHRGWGLGHARWLALKLGILVFLVVPLECMHIYVNHVWIARDLRRAQALPLSRELLRGMGVDQMIRTLSVPLLGLAVPVLLWLSFAKPL